ncbi:Gfo/Idh/MocA family protein [Asticcacaulis sp. AC402]|uniref:Gfo/Idh/MocA family protein n=1 Tax=Asticcacaulis sp. AC402 TaxID=1282361 RepID=UPI0003C3B12C|nr:Gfo/Idh/MocA family oxidoreductase [Asticcacaulis sp. AC402]ESQ75500.1 oxidoreductase [Asticcacaulis sp. AC402]
MLLRIYLVIALLFAFAAPAQAKEPMPIGVVGLSHDHVHWLFGSLKRGDVKIVGIVEKDRALAKRYADQYGFSMDLVHDDIGAMLDSAKPQAVAGFGPISDHVKIVRAAAPRGVHVMVEKPLALNAAEGREMAGLAQKHQVQVLTNYETSWYPSVAETKSIVSAGALGPVRKMVIHDGHQGPKAIGVSKEFLSWLTDPVQNGGGAVIDFGCYGANLMTWLNGGLRPVAVTATLRTFQPGNYPKVDDEATIFVDYADAQGIIQASWNWPVSRKDIEIYGTAGQMIADDRDTLRRWGSTPESMKTSELPGRTAPFDDPFAWFSAVVSGEVRPDAFDPGSLENNLIVMEILDAARESARSGKTVTFK